MSSLQNQSSLGRVRGAATFEACLPRKALAPPSGADWLHEIKHDGFRILAQKDGANVRLITRNGHNFADRYPLIMDAIARLPVQTCIIDGEAVVVDQSGLSVFDLLRYRTHDHAATLRAFDLLELNGADVRRTPIEERKRLLARALHIQHYGMALNACYDSDGPEIYDYACALGCEGIVSKRRGSREFSGRPSQGVKHKDPVLPAGRGET